MNDAYVIDIESNNLLSGMLDYSSLPYKLNKDANLWCIVIRNVDTNEVKHAVCEQITKEWMKDALKGCKYLIGHNVLKFDFLVSKLFGVLDYSVGYLDEPDKLFGEDVTLIDTLILSRLFNPDRQNGHSLESWGYRTGMKLKTEFRKICIEKGYIAKDSPKGEEFKKYVPEMLDYCIDDTEVNRNAFLALVAEKGDYSGWNKAIKMENKLADLAIRRETFGFWFDKDLAVKCVEDLTQKMEELQNKVNPILPPKPMTKGDLNSFTPPNTQFLKNGQPSTHVIKFAERIGGRITTDDEKYYIEFEGNQYELPFNLPLKTHTEADISNLDHVKMTLTDVYGWQPTEWAIRDFTKDSKKQSLLYDKRVTAFERWLKETQEGKYTKLRLETAFNEHKVKSVDALENKIKEKLTEDYPVKLPTSPKVRVGIEKDLCPNLTALGEKVEFAKDFALFLTYKHRKSSIAGGELEDVDFDAEYPTSGFMSMYRETDSRIPTPAIEIGASSCRYRHIGVANVARSTSVYGKEMRSLFGAGKDGVQLGFDFASLEARIQGHYCWKYTDGQELAKTLLAEKPNDIHTVTGLKLGIPRSDAKSVNYMLIYGGKIPKVEAMLGVGRERATEIYNGFWDSVPSLKELKSAVTEHWKANDRKWIAGIDGRKITTRSEHSLLNSAFQSAGVIAAKYVTVLMMQDLEQAGYKIDPFKSAPDVCSMIEYHDECQLFLTKTLPTFKTFSSENEAKEFVKNWGGEGQLSAISKGKTWYVTLPNSVSLAVEKAIKKTESILKLNVELGYEWIVSNNWYGCH